MMKPAVSKNAKTFREPIDGGWENVLPYLHQFEEGPVLETGLRTQVREIAVKWSEVLEETSFHVLFKVPEDPMSPAFSWALRPFLQGMGWDFDSAGPIHLIAKRLCEEVGIDFKVLYREAHPEGEDPQWIDALGTYDRDLGPGAVLDPVLALQD